MRRYHCVYISQWLTARFPPKYWPFHSQEWSISNFPYSLTRNITSHSLKNLAFRSLLGGKMTILPILTTSLLYIYFQKVGRMYFLNLRVYLLLPGAWFERSNGNEIETHREIYQDGQTAQAPDLCTKQVRLGANLGHGRFPDGGTTREACTPEIRIWRHFRWSAFVAMDV